MRRAGRSLLSMLRKGLALAPVLIPGMQLDAVDAAPPQSVADTVPVIFDTDMTGDVDDVLALAMLHALADRRECDIRAVTISKVNPLAAPFVDAVNTFYGRPGIPIGATADAQRRASRYLSLINSRDNGQLRYPHDAQLSQSVQDAVQVLRSTLAAAEDHEIVLIQVGLATNLADLVESPPDSISSLPGDELIRQKVRFVSVMAGAFRPVNGDHNYQEANVKNGVHAMQRFARLWPQEVPVVWSDFPIGVAVPYPRTSIARDFDYLSHHIVKEAYLLHSGPDHDRPTWDLTSVLYAVRPEDDYFGLSPRGQVEVADNGCTTFSESGQGRDRYLTLNRRQAVRVIATQRTLVSQPPSPLPVHLMKTE